MPRYYMLAFTNAVSGRESEFDRWYDELHLADVLSIPGVMRAQRFQTVAGLEGPCPWKFLTLYELETQNPAALMSIALAIARGFPGLQRAAGTLHGAHVAYGLLVQFMLEERAPAFIEEIAGCHAELGLPARLADFGLDCPTDDEVRQLAAGARESPSLRRFVRHLSAADVEEASRRVERARKQEKRIL
jgi:hypothetical protein